MFLIKLITGITVVLTMYASIIVINDDVSNNKDEITTLNRKITSLEAINLELESDINNLNMIMKGLRGALNDREINVDKKIEQVIDEKWKEQSATGGLGVLTGDYADLEKVE